MSKRNRERGQEAKAIATGSRFSEHRLTSRAGSIVVARFVSKLGPGKIIDETAHLQRGANVRYPLGKIPTGIALGIVSGCRHISHLCELTADEVFMKTQGWKVIVRADSAFFSIEFLRELHQRCCGNVVKMKIRGWKTLCAGLAWQKAHGREGVRTAEFFHKLHGWQTTRRFVTVRRVLKQEAAQETAQGCSHLR